MTNHHDLLKKGSLVELYERKAGLAKKFERSKGDVMQYTYPTDMLEPIGSCELDLAAQAMREMVEIKAEYLQIKAAIAGLEG